MYTPARSAFLYSQSRKPLTNIALRQSQRSQSLSCRLHILAGRGGAGGGINTYNNISSYSNSNRTLQMRSSIFPTASSLASSPLSIISPAAHSHLLTPASLSSCQHFSNGPIRPNAKQKQKQNSNTPKQMQIPSIGVGAAAASIALLTKSKSILTALKLTKFASLGSMLLTVGTYSAFYGLPYAAGMVGLILTHESGHALVMKKLNVPFSPMIFVPFLGASVAMKKQPRSAYDEALIALGGPALGTAGSFVVWGAAGALDSQLCYALADFGFMINLFNMIPIGMLDGGRIGNALSPYSGLVGVGVAGSMIGMGYVTNPIFYLITLAGTWQTGSRLWKEASSKFNANGMGGRLYDPYYTLTTTQRNTIAGSYFGLLAVLFGAMATNEAYKKSPERLRYEQRANSGAMAGTGLDNIHRDY